MDIKISEFGTPEGEKTCALYTMTDGSGMSVSVTDYGASLADVRCPDREGNIESVLLGFSDATGYQADGTFIGATIGRYANRIEDGAFTLNGETYKLPQNNDSNNLHGGPASMDKVRWETLGHELSEEAVSIRFQCVLEDGHNGFPGSLTTTVTYSLQRGGRLRIDFEAVSDKDTVANLTNHAYFNLSGDLKRDCLTHDLRIYADSYTPVKDNMIPSGVLEPVEGGPFDFRETRNVGQNMDLSHPQVAKASGFDHNFALRDSQEEGTPLRAELTDPESGRVMKLYATQPGLHFYSGNFLEGGPAGKEGRPYRKHEGCCLETQFFPDSPNQAHFPSATLKAGERYEHHSIFEFSAE